MIYSSNNSKSSRGFYRFYNEMCTNFQYEKDMTKESKSHMNTFCVSFVLLHPLCLFLSGLPLSTHGKMGSGVCGHLEESAE